jgi:hypothetical protein
MKQYNKYLIRPTDQFDVYNFPAVADEVRSINEKINNYSPSLKVEILISFLKDHSLDEDWISANPGLTEFITSGTLLTGGIEALFDSSKNNPAFSEEFEKYLIKEFITFRPAEIAE